MCAMSKQRPRHLETLAIHAGQAPDPSTGAVTPAIHLSTTFERDPDGNYSRGHVYTRSSNPNRSALETCLAALEDGAEAAAFASGSAASASVFRSLKPGDHVIAPDDLYHGTARLLREVFMPWGIAVSFVDMSEVANVVAALREETALVWLETPSNPLLKIADIAAISEQAHSAGALVACDNTWATPVLQRPLELGADLVVHSTTKYLSGHSDVLGGAVISKEADDTFARIRALQGIEGAVPSPFDCWLTLRGIRTLSYRMRAHCDNAALVARALTQHIAVEKVYYPGLSSHHGHALAMEQMRDFGGMLSFCVRGGRAAAMQLAADLKLFTRATSLGGVESLLEHRRSVEGPESQTPDNLLRVSVGLEHPDDLVHDLNQALVNL